MFSLQGVLPLQLNFEQKQFNSFFSFRNFIMFKANFCYCNEFEWRMMACIDTTFLFDSAQICLRSTSVCIKWCCLYFKSCSISSAVWQKIMNCDLMKMLLFHDKVRTLHCMNTYYGRIRNTPDYKTNPYKVRTKV